MSNHSRSASAATIRRTSQILLTVMLFVVCVGRAEALPVPQGTTGPDGVVYLPLYNERAVQVVDPVAHKVLRTIPNVGDHPIVLKMLPDQSKILTGNFGPIEANIGVIDTKSGNVVNKIPTLGAPYATSTLSHDGRFLFSPTTLSLVEVIDTHTESVVRTLPLPGVVPIHLEIAPDDKSFYVFSSLGFVMQFDAFTGLPMRPPLFLDGFAAGWGGMSPDGKELFAVNFVNNVVWIDTQSWRVVRNTPMPLGSSPLSATLSPDGNHLWVCNIGTDDITVANRWTGAIERVIPTGNAPSYVGFSADGRTAYVSDLGPLTNLPPILQNIKYDYFYFLPPGTPGYLRTIDTATYRETGSTQVGTGPVAGIYPAHGS